MSQTFSGNSHYLFEVLVAVFSNLIQQKRVLDAGQSFPSSHFWNDRPSFVEKFYSGKDSFRLQQNSTFDHLYSKNKIREDHSKRSKVDKIYIKNAHLLINEVKIRHNSPI